MKSKFLPVIFSSILFANCSYAEIETTEAKETFMGKDFASLVLMQEQNGKKGFKLTYKKPKAATQEAPVEIAGYTVTTTQYAFEADEQTLFARYTATKDKEKREIVVLYNAYLSLLSGTNDFYFYVAEEYEKSIRYHAMFKSNPTHEQLKPIIEKALSNPDSALVATRWAGKESEIFIYDSTRLISEKKPN